MNVNGFKKINWICVTISYLCITLAAQMQPLIFTDDHILNCGLAALLYNLQQHPVFLCACVLLSQDQAFGELEKNSDKILQGTSSSDSSQPAHLHELLCSLQKQLLAYCHINCVTEVLAQLNVYHEQT